MAITKLNSLAIPPNTIVESDLSYPLTNFSSTGIDDNASSTAVTIDASQNVGIGTDSPNHLLELKASVATNATETLLSLENSNSSGASTNGVAIDFFASADSDTTPDRRARIVAVEPTASGGNIDLAFHTSASSVSSEAMRINSSGNVGIGTNPSSNLHVYNGANAEEQVIIAEVSGAYSNGAGVSLRRSGTEMGRINADYFDGMTFHATTGSGGAATERMRIDSSGNVGIGTSNPTRRLSVKSSGSGTTVFSLTNSGGTSEMFIVDDISGSGRIRSRNSSNTTVFQVDTNGNVTNTNNSYGAISDERLKSNIVDASSQLDDIMAVQVRSYTLNATGETHIGVVAQELEASGMSGLVQEDEEGMKSVKYSILYLKAIKALQEAVTRIETLEAEVAALKGA